MSGAGSPHAGPRDANGWRIGVCASRFNATITEALTAGAFDVLEAAGATIDGPHLVAGAFELPLIAMALASSGCDGVVALGCVIRGETPHFDLIATESARGLMTVMLETGVPVGNGIIATEDEAQASARSARGPGNKGGEAALATLEAVATLRGLTRG